MSEARVPTSAGGGAGRGRTTGGGRGALWRFLLVHEIDEYPATARRTGYLAVAVLATVVLYYTYYTQTGVTPNILRSYHMSFTFYVWIVIISNLLGAFASLPASKTDKLGRANVIIYGLLVVGLLITFGVPNAGGEWQFAIVISAIGLVEGAILVATPAMVRDYSPQLGRASAMGFWTIGPVAGSLITSIVARTTLSHFVDWQSQFIISGITSLVTFGVCLVFMKDLSSRLRDQLMVSARDHALVEARARGLSDEDVEAAVRHPWRQIGRWDLVGSAFGISVFLLIYYAAAAFFTIYYSVTFVNADGTPFSTSQVDGLNTWFWAADIVALVVAGVLSDRLRVRKPLMLVGALGAIATLIIFLGYASNPHTSFFTLAFTSVFLAAFLSIAYAPWMASYTETVEAKNPALVGTGLALWGWILRLVVGISFIFLPIVITSVNTVVDNYTPASHVIKGQSMQDWAATHPGAVNFAKAHTALLTKIRPYSTTLAQVAKTLTPKLLAKLQRDLGSTFTQVLALQKTLTKYVQPYEAQLNYLAAHKTAFEELTSGKAKSPTQWQRWFWIDIAGMVVFIPTIWLARGRWSPRRARRDEEEHEEAVATEMARLEAEESGTPA